jgi:ribosomal-protein-alanine N-acetyltransferase
MSFLLETKRLYIRPFKPEDAEALHEIFGNPEVMGRLPKGSSPSLQVTRERLAKIIKHQNENGLSLWALIEKKSGKLIGDCGLIPVEGKGPEIELSYDISRAYWGKGYATEAAQECLKFGFEKLGLTRIIALTFPDHYASRRVMEKIGMIYEGMAHHYNQDLVQYSAPKQK